PASEDVGIPLAGAGAGTRARRRRRGPGRPSSPSMTMTLSSALSSASPNVPYIKLHQLVEAAMHIADGIKHRRHGPEIDPGRGEASLSCPNRYRARRVITSTILTERSIPLG